MLKPLMPMIKLALEEEKLQEFLKDRRGKDVLRELLLTPGVRREAGRVSGIGEQYGVSAGLSNRLPVTTRLLSTGAGAAVGSQLGRIIGEALGESPNDYGYPTKGTAIGAASGAGLGNVLHALAMRRDQRRVREEVEEELPGGRKKHLRSGNILAALVSGTHQQGRADSAEITSLGNTRFDGNPATSAAEVTGSLAGPAAALLGAPALAALAPLGVVGGMAGNTGHYLDARDRINRMRPSRTTHIE